MIRLKELVEELKSLGINVNVSNDKIVSELQTYKHGKYIFIWEAFVQEDSDVPTKIMWYNERQYKYNMFVIPILIFDNAPYVEYPYSSYEISEIENFSNTLKIAIGSLKKEIEDYINRCVEYGYYNLKITAHSKNIYGKDIEYFFAAALSKQLSYMEVNSGKSYTCLPKIVNFADFKVTSYRRNESGNYSTPLDAILPSEKTNYYCFETDYTINLI